MDKEEEVQPEPEEEEEEEAPKPAGDVIVRVWEKSQSRKNSSVPSKLKPLKKKRDFPKSNKFSLKVFFVQKKLQNLNSFCFLDCEYQGRRSSCLAAACAANTGIGSA